MLYFSETGWTLPDIAEVNAAFNRECDEAAYEQKIAVLIRALSADARANDPARFEAWAQAVRILRKEDHYLLVMIDLKPTGRPPWDFLKLILTGLAISAVLLAFVLFRAGS